MWTLIDEESRPHGGAATTKTYAAPAGASGCMIRIESDQGITGFFVPGLQLKGDTLVPIDGFGQVPQPEELPSDEDD
jgi:hypothetical protein